MSKVVLFQGDSITDGGRPREWEGLGSSYPNLIAAIVGEELAREAPHFINKGISGNRVIDMSARWNEDTFYYKPDIISILIGVNDAWRIVANEPTGVTDRFERYYDTLLAETKEILPNTSIILMEPFVLKTGATVEGWERWSKLIPIYQQKVKELAEKYDAVFVPLQQLFDEACQRAEADFWLFDGVHPSPAGHALIAKQWLHIVKQSSLASFFQK